MPRRWTAATPRSCFPVVLLMLALPRCIQSSRADKAIKEDYVSATVNATVLDSRGNPKQMLTLKDGIYGLNSPKVDAKGIVIAPAPNHGETSQSSSQPSVQTSIRGTCVACQCRAHPCLLSGSDLAHPWLFPRTVTSDADDRPPLIVYNLCKSKASS